MSGRKLLSYETWVHAVSGATGSVIAMATFYPLDVVRQKLQLSKDNKVAESTIAELRKLVAEHGIGVLYQGMPPVLQSLCASNFIYFYTFHGLKNITGATNTSALTDLFMGITAGVVNVLTTCPLWVVNTRLKSQPQPFNSLLGGMYHIAKHEGPSGLWAGLAPSLLLVTNPAIQFMTYEAIKRRLQPLGEISAVTSFLIGAAAKAVATVATYPLQLAQTRLRHGDCDGREKDMNLLVYILNIYKKYGLVGLYKGLEAKLWQTILTAALMFAVYEKIAKTVISVLNRKSIR